MRILMLGAALVAVAGCKGSGTANNAGASNAARGNPAAPATTPATSNAAGQSEAAAPATAAAASLPADFPRSDLPARAAECVGYLGLAGQAGARPGGRDTTAMDQASDQWLAALKYQAHMSEPEIQQLVASTVNPLAGTPAAERDAAAAWCVENAPEIDPAG